MFDAHDESLIVIPGEQDITKGRGINGRGDK
jgi:hypothetical protein